MTTGLDLVTGGAGFIGSALVEALAAGGRRVRVLDDLSAGRRENLVGVPSARLDLQVADIRDPEACAAAVAGVDRVFHLAGLGLRRSLFDPLGVHEVNTTGTLHLLQAATEARVRRFIHVSSSEVYGTARTVPMTEDHPLTPTTPYGASKLAGEAHARAWHLSHGLPVVIVRPFNAYGPRCHHEGDSGEVIPRFVLQALTGRSLGIHGDGLQSRDFTHVADTARAIRLAGERPDLEGQTIHVGSGVETRIAELARCVLGSTGADVPVVHEPARPGDVRRLVADCSLARRALGWAPTIGLEQGLATVVAWYGSQRECPDALARAMASRPWSPSHG